MTGWRVGRGPLVKINDDNYGSKGTTVRFIARWATDLDVFKEDPSKSKVKLDYAITKKVGTR